jgi:hypothetical protein
MDSQVADQIRWALDYLNVSYDEDKIKKNKSVLRNNLYDYIKANGEPDEDGNLIFKFGKPLTMDGEVWYSGFMLQRRVSEFVNEDKAWDIVRDYDLGDTCVKTVEILDLDMLYVANQQGIVPDEVIDSILEQEETWALVKMKV